MYHQHSIATWLHKELAAIKVLHHHDDLITQHLLTSATLVDFPQFRNIHHLIPQVLDLRPKVHYSGNESIILGTRQYNYHQIEDSDKWEIYVKYRKMVSQLLIDGRQSSMFLVVQEHYVSLAEYLLSFLSEGLR